MQEEMIKRHPLKLFVHSHKKNHLTKNITYRYVVKG